MSQAGYEKRVNIAIDGSPLDFTTIPATTSALSHAGDVLDDTNMRDITTAGMRSRILGLRDWSLTATMLYDTISSSVVTILRDAWKNRTQLVVQYLPDGTVANGFSGQCFVETFNMSGDIGGLEEVSLSLAAAGELDDAINMT